MTQPLIIVGGGGHALSVADAALRLDLALAGFVAPDAAPGTAAALGWLGDEDVLARPEFAAHRLLNGVGSAGPVRRRRDVYLRLRAGGRHFATLIHPTASLSGLALTLGDAAQILASAVVNAGVSLGDNVLVNTAAVVEHGCVVGAHTHIATGATVCGDCRIGEAVHIGAGATVLQGITIGSGAVIAAGAVVTQNVEPLTLVAGVPARSKRHIDEQKLA